MLGRRTVASARVDAKDPIHATAIPSQILTRGNESRRSRLP